MIKTIFAAAALLLIAGVADVNTRKAEPNVYEAWTDTGIHLMMSDNGTNTPEDDIVIDWETNRDFEIIVND